MQSPGFPVPAVARVVPAPRTALAAPLRAGGSIRIRVDSQTRLRVDSQNRLASFTPTAPANPAYLAGTSTPTALSPRQATLASSSIRAPAGSPSRPCGFAVPAMPRSSSSTHPAGALVTSPASARLASAHTNSDNVCAVPRKEPAITPHRPSDRAFSAEVPCRRTIVDRGPLLSQDDAGTTQQLEHLAEVCALLESRVAALATNLTEEKMARVQEHARLAAMVMEVQASVNQECSERHAVLEELREHIASDLTEAVRLAVAEATKKSKEEIGRQLALRKCRSVTWGDTTAAPECAQNEQKPTAAAGGARPSCLKSQDGSEPEWNRAGSFEALPQGPAEVVELVHQERRSQNQRRLADLYSTLEVARYDPALPSSDVVEVAAGVDGRGGEVPLEPEHCEDVQLDVESIGSAQPIDVSDVRKTRHKTRKEQLDDLYDVLGDTNWRSKLDSDMSEFFSIYEDRGRVNTNGQFMEPRHSVFVGDGSANAADAPSVAGAGSDPTAQANVSDNA